MSKVLLFLGAGPNIGLAVVQRFKSKGWKVATASRSPKPEVASASNLSLTADFADPSTLNGLFETVTKELGSPTAVVYNPYSYGPLDAADPFAYSPTSFAKDQNVMINSLYTALHLSVPTFSTLPPSTPKPTFIATGNALNRVVWPQLFPLGVGKSATAHLIETGNLVYKGKYRFYYADQRKENGEAYGPDISGEAHADVFLDLAEGEDRGWEALFVEGKGIVDFGGKVGPA